MLRQILGILSLIMSGFFVYMVSFLSFFSFAIATKEKVFIIGGICIPLLFFHFLGLWLYRGSNWKTLTGITFISATSLNVFVIISMLSIKYSPEMSVIVDLTTFDFINDYLMGFTMMILTIVIGASSYYYGSLSNK